jgi:hypothetical protein
VTAATVGHTRFLLAEGEALMTGAPLRDPGEDLYWCYLDQFVFELQGARPAPSHP